MDAFLKRELASRPELLTATGRCSEHFGAGEAYLPFLEIATQLVSQLEPGRIAGFLKTMAPTWARNLPILARFGLSTDSADTPTLPAQDRMPRELTDFLAVLCTVRPSLLILEDLHWADGPSVDLLGYLARRIGGLRLLVVATYRPSEIEVARHPLRQALRGLSSSGSVSREIAPAPFSEPEVEAFLERELGVPVEKGIAAFVHRRTEGNPLFVVNVLRHLLSLDAIRVEAGRAVAVRALDTLSDEVPEGITNVIRSRFERLDEEDRRLLMVASVQGETFDAAAVAATLGSDELDVEERLDRLHRVHALVEPGGEMTLQDGTVTSGYRFVHAFYQDELYGTIPTKRRGAWHGALARLLLTRHGSNTDAIASALAVHFERAHDLPRAIEAFERSADLAALRSPREAGPLLAHAVTLAERLPENVRGAERARLLTRLGRHLGEAAEIVGDVGLYDRAEKVIGAALTLDPSGPHAAEARTTLGLVHLERGQNDRALGDLLAVARDVPSHAPALSALAYLYKNTGLWDRALEAQEAAGRLEAGLRHSIPRLSVLIYQKRFEEAHAESDALLRTRPRYGHFSYWKGIVYFYQGARELAREWIERGYGLDPDNFIARGVFAFILAHDGEAAEATRLLATAIPGAEADGTFTYWIAKVPAALGRLDEAVTWVGRAEALGYWNAPWIERDLALDGLRALPTFDERLSSIRKRQRAFAARVESAASVV